MDLVFKKKVYESFRLQILQKIELLTSDLNELQSSIESETKSTVGDKYETARAIMQTRKEQLNKQLSDALVQQSTLDSMEVNVPHNVVAKASLVKTNRGYFFMAVALGKLEVDGEVVNSISPQSPLGMQLLGLMVGNSASINNVTYQVEVLW